MFRSLREQFSYDQWANEESLRSIVALEGRADRPLRLLAHVLASRWLWLGRIGKPHPEMGVWPTLSVSECRLHLLELRPAWDVYLTGATAAELGRQVAYTNSKGERFTNTVHDILLHLLLHGAYHRGQIATLLRQLDRDPPYTDYIECVRRGHLNGAPAPDFRAPTVNA